MKHKPFWLMPFALSLFAVPGCGSDDSDATPAGNCAIVDLGDGTSAIRCPDGSELVVRNGNDGEKGDKGDDGDQAACTLDESEGKLTLTCGDQSVGIGDACTEGFPADVYVAAGEADGAASLLLFQVSNCTWVRGSVLIRDVDAIPELLSRIEKIDGSLEVYETGLEAVSLPNLTEVGSLYVGQNELIESVDFPALTKAGGLFIEDNAVITDLAFPSLASVEHDLYIDGNDGLTTVDAFASVETIGGWLHFANNPNLETVGNFTSLASVAGIELWNNETLVSVADFPALEEIAGFGEPIVGSLLYVANHLALSSFGKLGSVSTIDGDVTFEYNLELPQSDIDDLLDGIDITGSQYICGNKGGPAC